MDDLIKKKLFEKLDTKAQTIHQEIIVRAIILEVIYGKKPSINLINKFIYAYLTSFCEYRNIYNNSHFLQELDKKLISKKFIIIPILKNIFFNDESESRKDYQEGYHLVKLERRYLKYFSGTLKEIIGIGNIKKLFIWYVGMKRGQA